MADVLVDSNVLLDILTEDRIWFARSAACLQASAGDHGLVINPIIDAEVFRREDLPWAAAFLAGTWGMPLLTRDSGRDRGYFPRLDLVLP